MILLSLKNVKLVGINEKYLSRHYCLTPQYRQQKEQWGWEFLKNRPKCWDKDKPRSVRITLWTYKDIDSVCKCVLDAANGVIWTDDKQLTEMIVWKNLIKRGSPEAIEVEVE